MTAREIAKMIDVSAVRAESTLEDVRRSAEMAISKLENSGRTDFANRLQTGGATNTKGESM